MDENKKTPIVISTDSSLPEESQPLEKSKLPLIIGAVLLLFAGAGIGWYFSNVSQKQNTIISTPTETVMPSVTPITSVAVTTAVKDTNSTMQSYKNNMYEFQYPGEWVLTYGSNVVRLYEHQSAPDYAPDHLVYISLTDTTGKITFQDPVGTKVETGDKIFVTKLENVSVDGKTAMRLKTEVMEGSQTDAVSGINTILSLGGGSYLTITINIPTETQPTAEGELLYTYDELLKSFKFVK